MRSTQRSASTGSTTDVTCLRTPFRHPEALARSASLEGRRSGPYILRGPLRGHLRMTNNSKVRQEQKMDLGNGLGHLTYSTLVHPADDWPQLWNSLNTYLPKVKARFAGNKS